MRSKTVLSKKEILMIHTGTAIRTMLLTAMVMLFNGCGDTTNNYATPGTNTAADVIGEVNDAASLQPVSGATVVLTPVSSSAGTSTTTTSADGAFVLSSVPVGSYTMQVTAAGFAASAFSVNVSSTAIGTPAVRNIGHVVLGKTMDLTVVATNNGAPVAGVPVMAFMTSVLGGQCGGYYLPITIANGNAALVLSMKTGPSGTVVLSGLSQCGHYEIIAAAFDSDGDGLNDYASSLTYYSFNPAYSNTSIAIAITSVPPYTSMDPLEVIASNMRKVNPINYTVRNNTDLGNFSYFASSSYNAIGSIQPIRLVLNYPVSLSGSITASYAENLIDPDGDGNSAVDAGFPVEMPVVITASLDPTGMILTLMPPIGGFPVNHLMKIRGAVNTIWNNVPQTVDLRNVTDGPDMVYISDDGVTGLNPATTITADNYNGGNGLSGTAYLEFPEYVTGSMRVISYTKSGTVTVVNSNAITTTGEIVFTDGKTGGLCSGTCGNGAGVSYRVNTNVSLSDGDLISVDVDVTDSEGNRLSKQVQLIVQ
jgi:hypothetical protein